MNLFENGQCKKESRHDKSFLTYFLQTLFSLHFSVQQILKK